MYKPSKSCISVPCSPFSLLAISLIVSQNWTFWGLVSQCGFQVLGFLHWETNSSLLKQRLLLSEIPPSGGSLHQGWGFWQDGSLPLLPVSMWHFYPLLWRSCSASGQVFFRRNYFIWNHSFSVSVGGSGFRIFLHCHPDCPSSYHLYC